MDGMPRSKCCGATLKRSFYGGIICSNCRTDIASVGKYRPLRPGSDREEGSQ